MPRVASILILLSLCLVAAAAELPAITIVSREKAQADIAGDWWTTDDLTPLVVPVGSEPIPVPGQDGLMDRDDFLRFASRSLLNANRNAIRLLGPPSRRVTLGPGRVELVWDKPRVRDAKGIPRLLSLTIEKSATPAYSATFSWCDRDVPLLR